MQYYIPYVYNVSPIASSRALVFALTDPRPARRAFSPIYRRGLDLFRYIAKAISCLLGKSFFIWFYPLYVFSASRAPMIRSAQVNILRYAPYLINCSRRGKVSIVYAIKKRSDQRVGYPNVL